LKKKRIKKKLKDEYLKLTLLKVWIHFFSSKVTKE